MPRPDQAQGGSRSVNFALPPGGPIDNVIPPNDPAYALLTSGSCGELLRRIEAKWVGTTKKREFHLYRGAARACTGDWEGARSDRAALGGTTYDGSAPCPQPPTAQKECEKCKAAVLRWLDSVLAARAKDPSFSPAFIRASGSSQLCPATKTTKTPTTKDPSTTDPSSTEPPAEDPAG